MSQVVNQRSVVTSRQLRPAESRSAAAVIELCMAVPADFQHISLTVEFSKAFLTVFEHPPDAARCVPYIYHPQRINPVFTLACDECMISSSREVSSVRLLWCTDTLVSTTITIVPILHYENLMSVMLFIRGLDIPAAIVTIKREQQGDLLPGSDRPLDRYLLDQLYDQVGPFDITPPPFM